MTYSTLATMQSDNLLYRRLVACAAEQQKTKPYEQWVIENLWDIVVSPGWAASWEYAEALNMENIGSDPGVITDGMILAVIQPMDAPDVPDNNLPVDGEPVQPLPEEPPVGETLPEE